MGYDLNNSDIKSLSVRHKKENNKFINKIRYHKFCLLYQDVALTIPTSSLKYYSNRGMDNFYNNRYAKASFQAILDSAVFYMIAPMTATVDQNLLRIILYVYICMYIYIYIDIYIDICIYVYIHIY